MAVLYESIGEVVVITIDRPDRRNAVDRSTAQALFDAAKRFDADEDAAVAVLTGSGDAFCAGADLKAISEGTMNVAKEDGELGPMGPTRLRLSKPIIAAIEGPAVAGGMELALWCDLRVMGESAIFGIFCRRFGVPLIDMGTIRLPRLIGHSRATDLILTGREVGAAEALQFGLANRVAPDGEARHAAIELANSIATFPQACMRNDRQSMFEQWDLPVDEAQRNEIRLGLETIRSGETVAGATRFSSGQGRHGAFGKEGREPTQAS